MRRSISQPWDWPPANRGQWKPAPEIEGRLVREQVRFVQPAHKTGWNSPAVTRIADGVLWLGVLILKVMIAVPLVLMFGGASWLLITLLTLPK